MPALSVTIITFNAAAQLRTCLESVAWADEIVIIDSGSRDDTLAIARQFTHKIIHQEWHGYGPQKQFAAAQAGHDWIVSLDADEWLSTALADSLRALRAGTPDYQAYACKRRNRFMGRWLGHGEGYPDVSVRVFNRLHARWSEDPVHERIICDGPVGRLNGDLMHESERGLKDYLDKQNRYTTLHANLLYARGKRTGIVQLVASPLLRFMKFYLLRKGFMDGIPGLVHIAIGCFNSFMKYAKLLELHITGSERRD